MCISGKLDQKARSAAWEVDIASSILTTVWNTWHFGFFSAVKNLFVFSAQYPVFSPAAPKDLWSAYQDSKSSLTCFPSMPCCWRDPFLCRPLCPVVEGTHFSVDLVHSCLSSDFLLSCAGSPECGRPLIFLSKLIHFPKIYYIMAFSKEWAG